ncbi:unnamed protein product [Amoebophrya sp. A120]|nr:unnamed protein product [Amoebophrya sp. A120]|eukprot:GSA120T00003653001.1
MSSSTSSSAARVGFVGLGRMGFPMAAHLHKKFGPCAVWNRTTHVATLHAMEHGTTAVAEIEDFRCPTLFSCLPCWREVHDVASRIIEARRRAVGEGLVDDEHRFDLHGTASEPSTESERILSPRSALRPVSLLIDCTSGEYAHTIEIGEMLAEHGITFVDCPVSGGPRGAQAATVTAMFGGNSTAAVAYAKHFASAFAAKRESCGALGSAHAVKSINNILNSANLATTVEGLLVLRKLFGDRLDLEKALRCINSSSGRSLQSIQRVPEEVFSRRFGYGFDLQLMQKDCDAARNLILDASSVGQHPEGGHQTAILPRVAELLDDAASFYQGECDDARKQGEIIDYTYLAKFLEDKAGITLEIES